MAFIYFIPLLQPNPHYAASNHAFQENDEGKYSPR